MGSMLNPADLRQLDMRELCAWRGMLKVHAAMVKALDHDLEARHGLSLSTYEVLMYLADAEAQQMRMCDLASTVLLSRSGLTRLVDRLAKVGLIARVACCDDARGSFARLTPAGHEKLAAARATHLEGVRRHYVEPLSDAELETLGAVWNKLLRL